jgi:hypothetical protein
MRGGGRRRAEEACGACYGVSAGNGNGDAWEFVARGGIQSAGIARTKAGTMGPRTRRRSRVRDYAPPEPVEEAPPHLLHGTSAATARQVVVPTQSEAF